MFIDALSRKTWALETGTPGYKSYSVTASVVRAVNGAIIILGQRIKDCLLRTDVPALFYGSELY